MSSLDLKWLREQVPCPLLINGLLHAEDAKKCVEMGCDGLVVSNHGGRVLASAPASLDVLPSIKQAIEGRIPILLDSGIRSGQDVYKALALGASAVMIGRPYICGLAASSAMGVAHIIRLMRDEPEMTMALTGQKNL